MIKLSFSLLYFFIFSILSKILTISESTLIYRKRLRSLYRDHQNEQRTVRQIQQGRMKYEQKIPIYTTKATLYFFLHKIFMRIGNEISSVLC